MSRQPMWDTACRLQADMFAETAALGGLDIQLVYYRGFGEFHAAPWLGDSAELVVPRRIERNHQSNKSYSSCGPAMSRLAHDPAQSERVAVAPETLPAGRFAAPKVHPELCWSITRTSGSGTMNLPPRARNSASRSRNSSRKCQGSTR